MKKQRDEPERRPDVNEPPRSVENGQPKRTHEKPLKIYGTLDDVLRAAVKEKPTVAE